MDVIGLKVLSSYEKGILRGSKKTKADSKIEDMCTQVLIKRMLKQEISMPLNDGTTVTATAEQLIIAAAIGDAIHKGSFDKVATLLKTTGELTGGSESKIEISFVDEDLAARAIK